MHNQDKTNLLVLLDLPTDYTNPTLELLLSGESLYLRDLRLNIEARLTGDVLTKKEIALVGIAIATNENNPLLLDYFKKSSKQLGIKAVEIAEAIAAASWMATNNTLYRFKHFASSEKYAKMPARLRMRVMKNPVVGEKIYELMSTAVSAVNGCEDCVAAHEKTLLELGVEEAYIFEAIRLSSTLVGLSKIIY